MRRYIYVIVALKVVLLALFGVVTLLGVPLLTDPSPWMKEATPAVAALGVFLLVADVLIPVPSSMVMVFNGLLFGAVGGTLLSLAGGVGAAALGFLIGRRGGPLLDRFMSPEERQRGNAFIARHGALGIVLSRPLPILAETVSIMAGTSPMGWGRLLVGATLGLLPPSILYAVAGAAAPSFEDQLLMFGAVIGSAVGFWLISLAIERAVSPSVDLEPPPS